MPKHKRKHHKNRYNICSKCGRRIKELPFKCHHCHQTFCSNHRLPEDHNCKPMEKYKEKSQERWQKTIKKSFSPQKNKYENHLDYKPSFKSKTKRLWYRNRKTIKKIIKWAIILAIIYFAFQYYQGNEAEIKNYVNGSISGFKQMAEDATSENLEQYKTNPKTVSLPHVGEYVVYEGLNDYLARKDRSISYYYDAPTTKDFILKDLDNSVQREYLMPLVDKIKSKSSDSDQQALTAIKMVQGIAYDWSAFETNNVAGRYPYEVLYDMEGVCMEKADLMAFLLRELGFGVVIFEYELEDHRAVGIKCNNGNYNTNYCFIEATDYYPVGNIPSGYVGGADIAGATPEVVFISEGISYTRH